MEFVLKCSRPRAWITASDILGSRLIFRTTVLVRVAFCQDPSQSLNIFHDGFVWLIHLEDYLAVFIFVIIVPNLAYLLESKLLYYPRGVKTGTFDDRVRESASCGLLQRRLDQLAADVEASVIPTDGKDADVEYFVHLRRKTRKVSGTFWNWRQRALTRTLLHTSNILSNWSRTLNIFIASPSFGGDRFSISFFFILLITNPAMFSWKDTQMVSAAPDVAGSDYSPSHHP